MDLEAYVIKGPIYYSILKLIRKKKKKEEKSKKSYIDFMSLSFA